MQLPLIDQETLLGNYSVLLIDAYGVLVDATRALPGALEFIELLHRQQQPYFVLTNDASRLPEGCAARYQELGLPIEGERVITSGSLVSEYFEKYQLAGKKVMVLGTEQSRAYVRRAGGEICEAPLDEFAEIEALVIGDEAGFDFFEGMDEALSLVIKKADAGQRIHLLLPNPDLIYPKDADRFGFAAGSLAAMLEQALVLRFGERPELKFVRLGKPHRTIFEAAYRRSQTLNMVMIGDQLKTDIAGARNFGIDSVLLGSGVSLKSQLEESSAPTFLLPSLERLMGSQP